MNNQVACCKIVFNIFYWAVIGVIPIIAIQVCDIPPAFEKQTTILTCTFDVDVTALKKDIVVLNYDNNDPHNPETVLYSSNIQGEMQYFTRPGFTVIGKVTNTLVLRVDRVTRGHIGRYECHILPSVAGDVEPCNFILERVNDTDDTSTYMEITVVQYSPDALKGHGKNFSFLINLIVAAVITTLALIGIVTVLAIFCKRIQQRKIGCTDYMRANAGSTSNGNKV